MDNTTERNVLRHRDPITRSRFTLRFRKRTLENEFTKKVSSNSYSSMGIRISEGLGGFLMTYYAIVMLYSISYIYTYMMEDSPQEVFSFQISLLLVSCLMLTILNIPSKITKLTQSIRHKGLKLIYFITCVSIVLGTNSQQDLIFNSIPQKNFNSILGLIPLVYTSKFSIFRNFISYVLTHILIFISFLTLSLIKSCTITTFIEFGFLVATILIEGFTFYEKEKNARDKFLFLNTASPIQPTKHLPLRTDIEEISHIIKETLSVISQSTESAISLELVSESLMKIMNLLGSKQNLYSVDMENMSKNIDDDEKLFIKEYCEMHPLVTGIFSNFFMKKALELVKNSQSTELSTLLKRISIEWNFDTFYLAELTSSNPLVAAGDYCIKFFDLHSTFKILETTFHNFFVNLESNYNKNPYHNSSHATDVLCSYLFLLNHSPVNDSIKDSELFAIIIACLGHDVGHPGLTNRFLVNSKHPLALLYNDYSVLEMMHCNTVFKIMETPSCNILSSLTNEQNQSIRTLIIDLILATDMSKHFDLIGKFRTKMLNSCAYSFEPQENRHEVMRVFLKAADVGHAAKCTALHEKWTQLVIEEFFAQGDQEKVLNLQVSMHCDREKTNVPKAQIGFIKNIVLPIFESIYMCTNSTMVQEFCVDQLENNMLMWEHFSQKKRGMTELNKFALSRPQKGENTLRNNEVKNWFK